MEFYFQVTFLNEIIREIISPTYYTPTLITEYLKNNDIVPTLETIIECIIRFRAQRHGNFCNHAITRVRELIVCSISPDEMNAYKILVSQVLAIYAPAPPPQITAPSSVSAFSVSTAMVE
ncbi:8252_t:CDS:1, partial [Scutellospora calospora]